MVVEIVVHVVAPALVEVLYYHDGCEIVKQERHTPCFENVVKFLPDWGMPAFILHFQAFVHGHHERPP